MNEYLILIIWCACFLIFYKLLYTIISQYKEEAKKFDFP